MKNYFSLTAFAIVSLAVSALAPAQQADPYQDIKKFVFGQDRGAIVAIEAEIAAAAPDGYKAIEAKLLTSLKDSATTVDGKRYTLRLLGIVGSADCVPVAAAYLSDEQLAHPARMALEILSTPAAGAALRDATGKLKGKLLAGIISSIAARRDAQAIPALSALVTDATPEVADGAIRALGMIGTEESAKALDLAAPKVAESLRRPLATAKVICAGELARAGNAAAASGIYKSLMDDKQAPTIRLAAIKGLIGTLPAADATKLLVDTIQGGDAQLRSATLAAFTAAPLTLRNAVAVQLPSFNVEAQLALIGVLASQPDVIARAGILKVMQATTDAGVKTACIDALARHGEPGDIPMLIKIAAGETDAAVARKTLNTMSRAGVDDELIRQIEATSGQHRGIVIAVLATRRVETAIPVLVKLATSADSAVAIEAIKGLTALGGVKQLPTLVDIIATTANPDIRQAAQDTAASICTKATDRQAAADAVVPAVAKAKGPGQIALIQILPRIRDDAALKTAALAAKDANADVAEAAIRALVEWPEISAAPKLLDLAKNASNPTHAVLAIRGYLRLASGPAKSGPAAERVAMYRAVLEVAQRPDEKKQALTGLGDTPAVAALDILQKYFSDKALAPDAMRCAVRAARQIGFADAKKAIAVLTEIKAQAANADLQKQAEEALAEVQKGAQSNGYIIAWLMAGPYTQSGKNHNALFDIAFDPEKPAAKVEWRPIAAEPGNDVRPVMLDKLLGGQDRVAYIKTQITSSVAQPAVLEVGSDDGAKVWLNGKVVLAANTTRPMQPASDRVKITLNQGANILLVKVTQGGGEWAACVRLVGADGKPIQNVTIELPN